MKRAALALLCAASLVAFSGLSGCSNSSGGGAPFVLPNPGAAKADSANEAAALREAAGKKYDAMAGEWVFDRSVCPWSDSDNGTAFFYFDGSQPTFGYVKTYPDSNGNTPKSLSIADRKYTLVIRKSNGQDKGLSCGIYKAYEELGARGSSSVKKCAKDHLNVDIERDDVHIGTEHCEYDGAFLKLVAGELYFICDYSSSVTNTACLVFRKKGSSPSGGGSGTVSFSLQGKWKKQGDTLSGRYIQIKSDGTFDFYKNGSLYNLYTDRTFAQSGSSVTVGYTASVLSVSDKFAVSGSASEMKWTLEKSSYVTGGQTYEDTTNSAALQALWDIMGSEVTLVPYE
ncbi:MAG: hypothetical protein IJS51_00920 [Treponema sp.]|nr:hypothetical protein [Treponema sp.]